MRFSKAYVPTLKEAPSDSDIKSQEYLIRGGFIRKIAAGFYTYLPLGWKVIRKIEVIVRDEMNKAGSQEIMLPIVQPAELWQKSGRWDDYGPEMMKLIDRHNRNFTLGPTHEEIITHVIKNELISYKQFPVSLYQIATKFRDEIRPRFGVLRAREFIMKDAYSFHTSEKNLDDTYKVYFNAYSNILKRIGVKFFAVEADSGAIGGNQSHEFAVLANEGESNILFCESCGYAATDEKAESGKRFEIFEEKEKDVKLVKTPNVKTVEQVADYLYKDLTKIIKSIVYKGKKGWKLILIRGDYEINNSKVKSYLEDQTLEIANPDEIFEKFNVPVGFIGPRNINIDIYADYSIKSIVNGVCGAMEKDKHLVNINPNKDINILKYNDFRVILRGEKCPNCENQLDMKKGIEAGQVFKLGTKYSEKLEGYYTNESGKQKPYIMGCYGYGVSRTLAAVVEQLHDEKGIIWPRSIAPYEVIVISLTKNDKKIIETSEKIYDGLISNGVDVILDDREASPGFKFKDSDLIGIPIKVIVGKTLKDNKVEIKLRYEDKGELVDCSNINNVIEKIKNKLDEYNPLKIK